MNGQRRIVLVAMLATLAIITGAAGANGTATWSPVNTSRVVDQPRTENFHLTTLASSGSSTGGGNMTAISSEGTVNYLHNAVSTNGAGGAVDWNNVAGRSPKYPYFGANTVYGGNDAPIANFSAPAATSRAYFAGDCGVMRPHNLLDDFGSYVGAYTPRPLTGGTAQMTGGVVTFTTPALADFGYLEPGDRFQTRGFAVGVFNRSTIPVAAENGSVDPFPTAPYWRVNSRLGWNSITATPDVATGKSFTSPSVGGATQTLTTPRTGQRVFQGAAAGQMIEISGSTNATWNGFYDITTAEAAQQLSPHIIVVTKIAGQTAVSGAVSGPAVVTRRTDADSLALGASKVESNLSFKLTNYATGTGIYTTAGDDNGMALGGGQTVTITNAGAHNGTFVTTAATATTFTRPAPLLAALTAPLTGIATITDSPSVATAAANLGERGSDCDRIVYTRSSNNGVVNGQFWDGGGNTGAAMPCVAGALCGSTNAFNIAGGPTNGGPTSYLSEAHTSFPSVEAYDTFVYVTFMSHNGAAAYNGMCNNDDRHLYIRRNTHYGDWDTWDTPVKLNTGNVPLISNPSMSVDEANGDLYVVAVNAENGDIVLWTSTNDGGSFSKRVIGSTNHIAYSGFADAAYVGNNPITVAGEAANCDTPAAGIVDGPRSDSNGYGEWGQIGDFVRVAAHNGNVGAAWFTNSANGALRNVTSATTAAGVTTFTTSAPHNFNNGDRVRVAGMTDPVYNGIYHIGDQFQKLPILGSAQWNANVATFNTTNTAGLVVGEQVSVEYSPDYQGYSGNYIIASVSGTAFTADYNHAGSGPLQPADVPAGTGSFRISSLNGLPSVATTFKTVCGACDASGGTGTVQEMNNDGDRIIAKTCASPCTTWTTAGCPATTCVIHLAGSGAGSNCENYICRPNGPGWDQDGFPFYDRNLRNDGVGIAAVVEEPDTGGKSLSVEAGASTTGSRIGFAWVNDSGEGPGTQVINRGLYYRGWESSTNAWSVPRLVACLRGAPNDSGAVGAPSVTPFAISAVATTATTVTFTHANTGGTPFVAGNVVKTTGMSNSFFNNTWIVAAPTATSFQAVYPSNANMAGLVTGTTGGEVRFLTAAVNDGCRSTPAWGAYMSLGDPSLDFYGQSGIGVAYVGCPYTGIVPETPCAAGPEANGSEILYKESGNNGLGWGSDWDGGGGPPTQASSYTRIAIVPTGCTSPDANPRTACSAFESDYWRSSYNPDLQFDVPNDNNVEGCIADTNPDISPQDGCVRYVFFNGYTSGTNANNNSSYTTFLMRGVQT